MEDNSSAEATDGVERGGCLTSYLVFMIIANGLSAMAYILSPGAIQQATPRLSEPLTLVLGAGAFLNIGLAIAVWNWRRVGVFGFLAMGVLVFPLNLWLGIPIASALFGLIGPSLLAVLVRPKWVHFT